MALTVVELGPAELLGERRAELEQLWLDLWPGTSDRLYGILPRHTRRVGFLFLAAQDRSRIVGFAYGYVEGDGEVWHDRVARAMTEGQRERWLAPGELELVELGVHPSRRRRGVAGRLHDELLARAARPTAVLATEVDNDAAVMFYERRGWETIIPELRLGRLYRVMGARNHTLGSLMPQFFAWARRSGMSPDAAGAVADELRVTERSTSRATSTCGRRRPPGQGRHG